MTVKEMIKTEIEKLPENLLAEVFDFIQFLEIKKEKNLLAKASQDLSTASFKKIWDNKEDAVYDSLQKGRFVLVPFPFSNQTAIKKRPAVVISSDVYNEISSDIVIMAITSQTEKTIETGECLIQNWQNAGLLKPYAIKPAISTIEQILVLKKLGKLSANDLISMENTLMELLNLNRQLLPFL